MPAILLYLSETLYRMKESTTSMEQKRSFTMTKKWNKSPTFKYKLSSSTLSNTVAEEAHQSTLRDSNSYITHRLETHKNKSRSLLLPFATYIENYTHDSNMIALGCSCDLGVPFVFAGALTSDFGDVAQLRIRISSDLKKSTRHPKPSYTA